MDTEESQPQDATAVEQGPVQGPTFTEVKITNLGRVQALARARDEAVNTFNTYIIACMEQAGVTGNVRDINMEQGVIVVQPMPQGEAPA